MPKANGLLNLLLNVPADVRDRLVEYTGKDDVLAGKIEVIILLGSETDIAREKILALGATFEDMGFGFAIVTIDINRINDLASIPEIQYIELPKTLYTTDFYTNRDSCITEAANTYGLTGKGTLVGIIDSGIDYKNLAFINDDGTTRVEFIYEPGNNKIVYTKEDINRALLNANPYSVVPHVDDSGHGTFVAGIACAGNRIDSLYRGVAPESSIGVVKMTIPGKANNAQSTQLMRGIRYLVDKSRELSMPLSINLSFSTNNGNHKGDSLIEQYIDTVCNLERLSMSVSAGNEGNAAHHVGGPLNLENNIEINISSIERTVVFQFYKNILDLVSIEIINPQNFRSNLIELNDGYYEGAIGQDRYYIYVTGPVPLSMDGEITIALTGNDYLVSGVWKFKIVVSNAEGRHYDMWLPISESLDSSTRFLNPNPYNTLGIPATVERVISVGAYNSNTDILAVFSGRGRENSNIIKPDIVAPGIDVQSTLVDGGFGPESGTSMAAPHVTGAAALLLQWGLINGNDPILYGARLKAYLLKGAKRERNDVVYPNAEWGYGTLCLANTINIILRENQGYQIRGYNDYLFREIQGIGGIIGATGITVGITGATVGITGVTAGITGVTASVTGATVGITGATVGVTGITAGITGTTVPEFNNQSTNIITESTGLYAKGSTGIQGNFVSSPFVSGSMPRTSKFGVSYERNDYEDLIVQYEGDLVGAIQNTEGAEVLILNEGTAVLTVEIDKSNDIIANTKEIVYVITIGLYTQTDIEPVQAADVLRFHTSDLLQLRGNRTIIGIIDSGIDYLNKEFMYEDDTTRIISIWDQTIKSNSPEPRFGFGGEYGREDINRAIAMRTSGGDPYTIVPSIDNEGHGTAMASIVGARGYNEQVVGAAPDCEFAIVKLKEAKPRDRLIQYGDIPVKVPVYTEPDLIMAINYLNNIALREGKPMTILLPIGTNKGSHTDTGIIETYINTISERRGIAVVSSVGNEGNKDTHTSGILKGPGSQAKIELSTEASQRNLRFFIFIQRPAKATISITSPSGDYVNRVSLKYKDPQVVNFIVEGSTVRITYFLPEELTGDETIRVEIQNIATGTWIFTLDAVDAMNSRYDSWLPQRDLLVPETLFLSSTTETTLMEPSNANRTIAVGYYDQNNATLVTASGRGYTRDNLIKPDIIAGGVGAHVVAPNNGITTITGASVATAVVAGCTTLLFEWGIIQGKDPTMFVEKIKTYLANGAIKRPGSEYPNPIEGYGAVNLFRTFESIRGISTGDTRSSYYEEDEFLRDMEQSFDFATAMIYKKLILEDILE